MKLGDRCELPVLCQQPEGVGISCVVWLCHLLSLVSCVSSFQ